MLLIDANEDVYKGPFADHLAEEGVDMECAYFKLHLERMPESHTTLPLLGCFVTPGIDVESTSSGTLDSAWATTEAPTLLTSCSSPL